MAGSVTFEASTNTDIEASTRKLFLRTVKSQVLMKMPLFARLLLERRITWEGGKYITAPVDTTETDSTSQAYYPYERLTAQRKSVLDTPYFHWKYGQTPVTYDVEEYLQNSGGGSIQVVKLIKFLVQKAQKAARIKLYKQMYGIGTSGSDSDHDRDFQSIVEALTHDGTYGHVTRDIGSTTNTWWQSASIAESYADQATNYAPSIDTVRRALAACQIYTAENPSQWLLLVGPEIFRALQSQCEARHIYNRSGSMLARYGFNAMVIDGVEVVSDPYLRNSVQSNAHKWAFLLHVPSWELRLHPRRRFRFTGFKWQGDQADGYDMWLARILIAGNLVCWQPNSNWYASNVA